MIWPNNCVEPTGTSRSGQLQFARRWRLAPAAHARRWVLGHVMKLLLPVLLFAGSWSLAVEDTNLAASGEWSQPVATYYGVAIRGRLLICDTPDHASDTPTRTDTAVYLELQEFSGALQTVRVYCGLNRWSSPEDAPGLRCQLRDSKGKLVPCSPGGFGGSSPESYWVMLRPYCSARVRASVYGGGRMADGGLAIYLSQWGWWDVHPSPTNEYYLSGTFTAAPPTNELGMVAGTNLNVWHGTLTLPRVKIPVKKP
jgi:hypothetical protein